MRILIVGDSEACAVQPYLGAVKRPGDTIHVTCKGGTRIEAWSKGAQKPALVQALAQYAPELVIVMLGTNHYYDTSPPPIAPLVSLIQAGAPGARILWVGPTSVKGQSWPVDAWLATEAAAAGIPYVDTEKLGIPLRDIAHPTAAGARQWLRAIWEAIGLIPTPLSWPAFAGIALGGVTLGAVGFTLLHRRSLL